MKVCVRRSTSWSASSIDFLSYGQTTTSIVQSSPVPIALPLPDDLLKGR